MKSVLEKWKAVPGYKGLYEVSDQGNVRALNYNHTGKCKELKKDLTKHGYVHVALNKNAKRKSFIVHTLVWLAFVGEKPEGMQVDHINAVRDDNRLENLRIVTCKENANNPITYERHVNNNRRLANDKEWRRKQKEAARRKSESESFRTKMTIISRTKHARPVLQIDRNTGKVIREWECAADAARELGVRFASISQCCHRKYKSAGGFKWEFAS